MPEITDLETLRKALNHTRLGDREKELAILANVGAIALPISLRKLFVVFTNMDDKSLFSEMVVQKLNIGPNVPVVFLPDSYDSRISDDLYRYAGVYTGYLENDKPSIRINTIDFFKSVYDALSPTVHVADLINLHESYLEAADWFEIAVISEKKLELRRCFPNSEADAAFDLARAVEHDAKAAYDALSVSMLLRITPPVMAADTQAAHGNPFPPLPDLTVSDSLNALQLH